MIRETGIRICFHFSDGDNSSDADNRLCVKLLDEEPFPICNMFGYCQVTKRVRRRSFLERSERSVQGRQTR